MKFAPKHELLTFEEITFAVDVAVSLGVDKIRITGGEPLLRNELPKLIAMLSAKTDAVDIAMTTNALLLHRHAPALAEAGLDRVNVSLDSLKPDRFTEVTRNGVLEDVWKGIEAASEAGFSPIRINTLLLDGFNDDEVDDWLALTQDHDLDVRFMELMPIGEGAELGRLGDYLNLTDLRRRLVDEKGLVPVDPDVGNGPAKYWKQPGASGKIGFITPMSDSYCDTCSRMRMTAKGKLRACLAYDDHVDAKDAIRAGDREETIRRFRQAVAEKPAGHHWHDGQITQTGMSALGG